MYHNKVIYSYAGKNGALVLGFIKVDHYWLHFELEGNPPTRHAHPLDVVLSARCSCCCLMFLLCGCRKFGAQTSAFTLYSWAIIIIVNIRVEHAVAHSKMYKSTCKHKQAPLAHLPLLVGSLRRLFSISN